jgi:hypothetical protein
VGPTANNIARYTQSIDNKLAVLRTYLNDMTQSEHFIRIVRRVISNNSAYRDVTEILALVQPPSVMLVETKNLAQPNLAQPHFNYTHFSNATQLI